MKKTSTNQSKSKYERSLRIVFQLSPTFTYPYPWPLRDRDFENSKTWKKLVSQKCRLFYYIDVRIKINVWGLWCRKIVYELSSKQSRRKWTRKVLKQKLVDFIIVKYRRVTIITIFVSTIEANVRSLYIQHICTHIYICTHFFIFFSSSFSFRWNAHLFPHLD